MCSINLAVNPLSLSKGKFSFAVRDMVTNTTSIPGYCCFPGVEGPLFVSISSSNNARPTIFAGRACVAVFFPVSSDVLSGWAVSVTGTCGCAGGWVVCFAPRTSNVLLSSTSCELFVLVAFVVGVCRGGSMVCSPFNYWGVWFVGCFKCNAVDFCQVQGCGSLFPCFFPQES